MEEFGSRLIFTFKACGLVIGSAIFASWLDHYFDNNHPGLKGKFAYMEVFFIIVAMVAFYFKG